eukprot:4964847-Amphidinium_carterae.2
MKSSILTRWSRRLANCMHEAHMLKGSEKGTSKTWAYVALGDLEQAKQAASEAKSVFEMSNDQDPSSHGISDRLPIPPLFTGSRRRLY